MRTAWSHENIVLAEFHLIIGSDLLYERENIESLAVFLDPHDPPNCDVIIGDTGRGNHARFSRCMVNLGYSHSQSKPVDTDYLAQPFKGQILRYAS